MKKVVFLCLTFTSCLTQTLVCPSEENIKPCTCSEGMDKKAWVSCEGFNSLDGLRKAVDGMKNHKLSTFYLTKSDISILPADLFSDVEIQHFNIMFTNLTSLSERVNRPPFLGQEKCLESIEIKDSFTALSRLPLSHLKKLTLLQLEGNSLPIVGNDWFESGPYTLRELHLLDTRTNTLGSHAFFSLANLRKISFTGGHIESISRALFPEPALFLEAVDFSNNKIEALPDDLFSKMPSLSGVTLENNDLKTINEVTFAPVWSQMTHVLLYGNPLFCDQNIKWIYKYRLPESLQGYCAAPRNLRFKSLANLTLADLEEKKQFNEGKKIEIHI